MNHHFRRGLAKGLPIAIGYMPIAIAFYRANLVLIVLVSILAHYGLSVLIAA